MSSHPRGRSNCEHCGGDRILLVGNTVEGCPWCKDQPAPWEKTAEQLAAETSQNVKAAQQAVAALDTINHPPHYNKTPVEPIVVIEAWQLGFCLGNTVKYIARAKHKGSELEDLKKALWYLEREIQNLESDRELRERANHGGMLCDIDGRRAST